MHDRRSGTGWRRQPDRFALDGPVAEVLRANLEVAVPLRIRELQDQGHSDTGLLERCHRAAEEIASHGDNLLFPTRRGGRHRPGTAEVFAALVDGLAAGALLHGAITMLGVTFSAPPLDAVVVPLEDPELAEWAETGEPGDTDLTRSLRRSIAATMRSVRQ